MPRFSPFRPTRSIEINRGVEDQPRNVCAIGLAYLALTLKRLTQPVVAFKMIWDHVAPWSLTLSAASRPHIF
jgi:hypothetical protein